jgi:protocatechuate 3,4-dioxygenase beta subunit
MLAARRLVRQSVAVDDEQCRERLRTLLPTHRGGGTLKLRESLAVGSPLCVGWRRHSIVLPSTWRTWPAGHLAAALAHELAHALRRDVAWQLSARMACAIYWFHPLAWLAAWRMRVERESACDDWALATGQSPARYARILLDIAVQVSLRHSAPHSFSIAMVGRRGFERRIRAILAGPRRRGPVGRATGRLLAIATLVLTTVAGTISPLASSPVGAEPRSSAKADDTTPQASLTAHSDRRLHVKGRVVDERGQGVSGARVEALTHRSRPVVSCNSVEGGNFEIDVPKSSEITLRATADDGARQAIFQFHDDQPLRESVDLELQPAREVNISVVDGQLQPVAEAWVAAMAYWNVLMDEATTDEAGEAVLRVPANAELQYVMAEKPDVGLDYVVYRRASEPVSDPYKLPPDHGESLTLVLNGSRTVDVRVVDHEGRPQAGVRVYPWYFEKAKKGGNLNIGAEQFQMPTDENGRAVFRFVPADNVGPIVFGTISDDHVLRERVIFDPARTLGELTATLLPLVPIRGRVILADGAPAAGAEVDVSGVGYQTDSFRTSVRAGADGRFEVRVYPDQFCLFAAVLGRTVSNVEPRVVRLGASVSDVDLALGKATRVHGRVTAGDGQPVAGQNLTLYAHCDDDYLQLPIDEQLPAPSGSRKRIQPRITRNATTDERGEFELLAGPGHCYVLGPGGVATSTFRVTAQDELEFNFEINQPQRVDIARRVVMHSDSTQGVDEAEVLGIPFERVGSPSNSAGGILRAVTGADGWFRSTRPQGEMWLHARTTDLLLAGIVRIRPTDPQSVVPIAPTASAHGRLVDKTTQVPLAHRQLDYGVQIQRFARYSAGNATTNTNSRGEFLVHGFVPGWECYLDVVVARDQEGRPNRHWPIIFRPDSAATVELGDVAVGEVERAPTLAELVDRAFLSASPLQARFQAKLAEAQRGLRPLLVIVADRDSSAAKRFFGYYFGLDDEIPGRDLRQALGDCPVWAIDAAAKEMQSEGRRFTAKLNLEWPQTGAAVIGLVGANGILLGETRLPTLAADGCERLAKFLNEQLPAQPDAQQLLAGALARAKHDDKRVLIECTRGPCGPSVLMSRFVDSHRDLLEKDYICIRLDGRFIHAEEVMARLRQRESRGIPCIVIVDADGKRLAASDARGSVGYPNSPAAVADFESMFVDTSRNLTVAEIERLVKDLSRTQR